MDIVAFVGLLAHHTVETNVTATDQTVLDGLLDMVTGIELVGSLVEDILGLFFLDYGLFSRLVLNFFCHRFQL